MSSGSCATRNARRLPAALTTPELVSPLTTRSTAASISPVSTISSQISRPSGLSQSSRRSYWIACRAMRSPVKRGKRILAAPGMMPSLRAGKVRNALRRKMANPRQGLAVAADGKGFDRRDPRLLDGVAAELVGWRVVGEGKPAIDLVDVAEIALEIPNERDAAVIEMREIDAGAEH